MAFKWTKKDTEAFNGIYGSVKQGLQDYNEARAGDLYDQELAKGVDTNWTATGVPQVDEYGLPVTDVAPQTRGLSINERRRNALNASADYLTGKGYRKLANEQYDQADQMGLRDDQRAASALQRQLTQHQIAQLPQEDELRGLKIQATKGALGDQEHARERQLLSENLEDTLKGVWTGSDPLDIEKTFNKTGKYRIDDGTLKIEPVKNKLGRVTDYTLSGMSGGKPFQYNASALEEQLMTAKDRVAARTAAKKAETDEQYRKDWARIMENRYGASGRGGLTGAKAKRMEEMDTAEDGFYEAIDSGDFAKARKLADRLGNSFDNRGVIKMKETGPDGTSQEVLKNKYALLVEQHAMRAGLEQAKQINAGLRSAFPKARFDDVGVDVETGEQVVKVGGKAVPLDEFVAMQEKRYPSQRTPLQPTPGSQSRFLREGGGAEQVDIDTLRRFANGGLFGRGGVYR